MSWPYHQSDDDENSPVLIKARSTPGDATTLETYRISGADPDLRSLEAQCQRDMTVFLPKLGMGGMIDCPTCHRGYENVGPNQWMSDRPLVMRRTN